MLSYKPSLLAASVVYLAMSMETDVPWVSRQLLFSGLVPTCFCITLKHLYNRHMQLKCRVLLQTQQLREYTGYTVEQIMPCARQISEHVNKNPITASKRPLHAVRKKFEAPKFMGVAEENPPVL